MEKGFKGEGFLATIHFIEHEYDQAAREKIYATLSPEARKLVHAFQKNEWYPRKYADELWRACAFQYDDPQRRYDELVKIGCTIGEQATTTFLRLLVKLLTPTVFARKFPEFWARYHNYGVCEADVSSVDQNKIIITLKGTEGFETLCGVAAGWIISAFRAMGKKTVRVTESNAPNIVAVPEIPYTVTWD